MLMKICFYLPMNYFTHKLSSYFKTLPFISFEINLETDLL